MKIAKEQLERSNYKRLNNTNQQRIPDLVVPAPPLLPPSRNGLSLPDVVVTLGSSPSDDSSVNETTQINKRNLARRSDKQMYLSDGSIL